MTLSLDGKLGLAASADTDTSAATLVDLLWEGLAPQRDQYRAIAVTTDVSAPGSDAVCVGVEHREGPAIICLLPYRKSRFRGRYSCGDLGAAPGEHRLWPG